MRSNFNLITALQYHEGHWHRDTAGIYRVAEAFYTKLFTSESTGDPIDVTQLDTRTFSRDMVTLLEPNFSEEEVKKCPYFMAGTKAPSPDGMSAIFFQHYWDTVKDDLVNMVLRFLNNGIFLKKFNFTHITLIRKIERPISMGQFRPIALCNTVVKVISKALAIRLKTFLPYVISETQSAFVPNRLITDNILLVYEAHHVIMNKKPRREGFMSIKLDMLKAYDRVELSFLKDTLIHMDFGAKWVSLIMLYVESVTYSLLIKGDQVGHIKPGRGLRQEDPL
ncbi:hypothetical protein LIER_06563 [Lithospermum erythrorhizon]|uniref:Reverse transcriptase domain-containing protein n=1 Tax=Lithospermum erythrorhizon TaxID=34254 RepID=A0AAV3P506_LITER